VFKLYHRTKLIGIIKNVFVDGLEMGGDVELAAEAEPYKPLFAFLTDDEKAMQEPPFPESMLEGWFIEDEQGVRREIGAPAISAEMEVYWRYF
jgi:hypothetical protein